MKKFLALVTLAASAACAHAATDPALDKVLRQLDASSAKFQSAECNFQWDYYERVVQDTSTQTGILYTARRNGQVEMGAVVQKPSLKVLQFQGNTLKVYDDATKQTKPFDVSQNRSQAESFLTLGFGGSGKDLEKTWNITLQGNETIDGVQTVKLDLVPKDPAVRNNFTHVTIWVDPARDISLKQVLETPSHDKRTNLYTNIRYNQKINASKYKLPKQ